VRSLRGRLFLGAAGAVLVSIIVTVAVGGLLVRRSAEREARKALNRQADLFAVQERAQPTTPARRANLGLFLATQQQRLTILSLGQATLLLPPNAAAALRAGRPANGSLEIRGTRFLYAARRVGQRAVILLRSTKLQAADWRPFGLSLLIAALIGSALAALAALFLARAIAQPVRRVADAARSLAAGNQPATIPAEGPSEAVALAEAFNEMAADLEAARTAERSFLLSVSHELKSPLTAISGHAEALNEGVIGPDKVAEVILREAKRLERLVQDLLDLARLNQRTFTVRQEAVDLGEIADEAAGRYQPQAHTLGLSLGVSSSGPAPAIGDPDRLLQVLSNLIENALHSTPAGGEITLTAEPGTISVNDTGPGIDAGELPHAFERFYLYDRYKHNRHVGSGLGLAIVKELTEAMAGTVTATSHTGEGTRFTITLPHPRGVGTRTRPHQAAR
jgi:signal transduction histidine kinase